MPDFDQPRCRIWSSDKFLIQLAKLIIVAVCSCTLTRMTALHQDTPLPTGAFIQILIPYRRNHYTPFNACLYLVITSNLICRNNSNTLYSRCQNSWNLYQQYFKYPEDIKKQLIIYTVVLYYVKVRKIKIEKTCFNCRSIYVKL